MCQVCTSDISNALCIDLPTQFSVLVYFTMKEKANWRVCLLQENEFWQLLKKQFEEHMQKQKKATGTNYGRVLSEQVKLRDYIAIA